MSLQLGDYSVSLATGYPIYDNISNTQKWLYIIDRTVTPPTPGGAISNFQLQLCSDHVVLKVSRNGVEKDAANGSEIGVDIGYIQNTCLNKDNLPPNLIRLIKWDVIDETHNELDFTLEGNYNITDVNVALKHGNVDGVFCEYGQISGPDCSSIDNCRGFDYGSLNEIDLI